MFSWTFPAPSLAHTHCRYPDYRNARYGNHTKWPKVARFDNLQSCVCCISRYFHTIIQRICRKEYDECIWIRSFPIIQYIFIYHLETKLISDYLNAGSALDYDYRNTKFKSVQMQSRTLIKRELTWLTNVWNHENILQCFKGLFYIQDLVFCKWYRQEYVLNCHRSSYFISESISYIYVKSK